MVDDAERQKPASTLDEILSQLESLPEPSHTYCSRRLLNLFTEQKSIVSSLVPTLSSESLSEHNLLIIRWLKNIYEAITFFPNALQFNLLELTIARSGLLQPFILGLKPDGELEIGIPTNEVALCDNLAEFLRVAGAAIVCFLHYLNFRHSGNAYPSDDGALLLVQLAIRSCQQQAARSAIEEQLAELPAAGMGLPEIRWLMHYVRGQLSGFFATVHYFTGNLDKYNEFLVAQQADNLALIKAVPTNLLGYIRYIRSCLQFQETKAAFLFATRGLVQASAAEDDVLRPQLLVLIAMATAMGGHTSSSNQTASTPTFTVSEVKAAIADAQEAADKVDDSTKWLPAPYHLTVPLDPELSMLQQLVLEQYANVPADVDQVPILDVPYVMQPPETIPAGALTQLQQAEGERGHAGAQQKGPRPKQNNS